MFLRCLLSVVERLNVCQWADWELNFSCMCVAVILPACHNAACVVFVAAAWSIMQSRTGYVPGGEAQIEVSWDSCSTSLKHNVRQSLCCKSFSKRTDLFVFHPSQRNQVVEMFDHAYQNYMVSPVPPPAPFIEMGIYSWMDLINQPLCRCLDNWISFRNIEQLIRLQGLSLKCLFFPPSTNC